MDPRTPDPIQLDLFVSDSPAYREALVRYEEIRPVLKGERTLPQQSEETGINYCRLWRDVRRFAQAGLVGLIDRRKLRHPRGRTPTTLAHRLERALGPEHLLIRFRTYREYPTEEQARWRIIELLEVGFRPRRVAKLLGIDAHIVYRWQRRFKASGLVGLTTRTRDSYLHRDPRVDAGDDGGGRKATTSTL